MGKDIALNFPTQREGFAGEDKALHLGNITIFKHKVAFSESE